MDFVAKSLTPFWSDIKSTWAASVGPLQLVVHVVQNRHAVKSKGSTGVRQTKGDIVLKKVFLFVCLIASLGLQHGNLYILNNQLQRACCRKLTK